MTSALIKKLPTPARKLYETVFNLAKDKYSESRAKQIALKLVKDNYKEVRSGKKSMAITQGQAIVGDFSLDVMLGYPGSDIQALKGGYKLSDEGWANRPMGVLKGDMEHYYTDKAEGLYVDLDEAWEGWVPVAQKFWHNDDGALMAQVELPEGHPQTPIFMNEWKSGKYGLSVEYAYPDEAVNYKNIDGLIIPELTEWHLTGFTFTELPSYTKTKNEIQ